MNGNLVTLLIILAVIVGLGIVLVKLILGLVGYIGSTIKAGKTFLTQPGATEAYEILTGSAENGLVPDDAIEDAILAMLRNGSSESDIIQFIRYCNTNIRFDHERAIRKLERREFRREIAEEIALYLGEKIM